MKKSYVFAIVVFVCFGMCICCFSPLYAAEGDIEKLLIRIEALEDENQNLKSELTEMKNDLVGLKQVQSDQDVQLEEIKTVAKGDEVNDNPLFDLDLYGFIRMEGIYSDSQVSDAHTRAPLETVAKDDDEYNLSVRATRLGVNIEGPPIGDNGRLQGKIEADLYGNSGGDSNSPEPRLRQAYIQIKYPDWDVLAGQTWDFWAPLNPQTVHFTVLWSSGNMGDRHPVLRVKKKFSDVLGGDVVTQFGIVDAKDDNVNDAGWPIVAGFASYESSVFSVPVYVGVGGIFGKAEAAGGDEDVWAGTVAAKLALTEYVSLIAEGYVGSHLTPFRAGGPMALENGFAHHARGGFAQLKIKPVEKLSFNLGVGIDDVTTGTATTGAAAVWDENWTAYVNAFYSITSNLILGIEYQYRETEYENQADSDQNIFASSLTLKF